MTTDLLRLTDLPGTWQYWGAAYGGEAWYAPADETARAALTSNLVNETAVRNGLLRWPQQASQVTDSTPDTPLF